MTWPKQPIRGRLWDWYWKARREREPLGVGWAEEIWIWTFVAMFSAMRSRCLQNENRQRGRETETEGEIQRRRQRDRIWKRVSPGGHKRTGALSVTKLVALNKLLDIWDPPRSADTSFLICFNTLFSLFYSVVSFPVSTYITMHLSFIMPPFLRWSSAENYKCIFILMLPSYCCVCRTAWIVGFSLCPQRMEGISPSVWLTRSGAPGMQAMLIPAPRGLRSLCSEVGFVSLAALPIPSAGLLSLLAAANLLPNKCSVA